MSAQNEVNGQEIELGAIDEYKIVLQATNGDYASLSRIPILNDRIEGVKTAIRKIVADELRAVADAAESGLDIDVPAL